MNPVANAGQFAAEKDVAAMWQTDVVQAARNTAAYMFERAYGRDTPDEARPSFDSAMDEYVTNYLFKGAASDPVQPRFVRDFMPAYRWHGRDVAGARMGGDNPDNVYRLAAIAHGGRYVVTGRPIGRAPANTSFTLTGNYGTSVTIGTIENHQLETAADGSFTITIDDRPPDGRRNHLTTAPNAKFLFVRDSLDDWSAETPYQLDIQRLDPPNVAPLSVEEMARRAAFRLVEEVPLYYWFQRLFSGLPAASVCGPLVSGTIGGLVTQAGAQAWFQLAAGEGVLLRYQPAGAHYAALSLTDWWFRSIDANRCQSSLTVAQSNVGDDGWIECVIAREDPGIANWLDTGGLSTVLFLARWQGLPATPVAGGPALQMHTIRLDQLKADSAGGRIDPAERRHRIDQRTAAWQRRLEES